MKLKSFNWNFPTLLNSFQLCSVLSNFGRFFPISLGSFQLKQKLFNFRLSNFSFFSNCRFQLQVSPSGLEPGPCVIFFRSGITVFISGQKYLFYQIQFWYGVRIFSKILHFDSKMITTGNGTCHHFSNCIQFKASFFYHKIDYWEYAGNPIQNQ